MLPNLPKCDVVVNDSSRRRIQVIPLFDEPSTSNGVHSLEAHVSRVQVFHIPMDSPDMSDFIPEIKVPERFRRDVDKIDEYFFEHQAAIFWRKVQEMQVKVKDFPTQEKIHFLELNSEMKLGCKYVSRGQITSHDQRLFEAVEEDCDGCFLAKYCCCSRIAIRKPGSNQILAYLLRSRDCFFFLSNVPYLQSHRDEFLWRIQKKHCWNLKEFLVTDGNHRQVATISRNAVGWNKRKSTLRLTFTSPISSSEKILVLILVSYLSDVCLILERSMAVGWLGIFLAILVIVLSVLGITGVI